MFRTRAAAITTAGLFGLGSLGLAACGDDDDNGDDVDVESTVDDIGDDVEDTVDDIGDEAEDTADDIDDEMNDDDNG